MIYDFLTLKKHADTPLYVQLYSAVKNAIENLSLIHILQKDPLHLRLLQLPCQSCNGLFSQAISSVLRMCCYV